MVDKRTDVYDFDSGDYGKRRYFITYDTDWVMVEWAVDKIERGFRLLIDDESGKVELIDRWGVDCDMVAMVGLLIDLEVRGELILSE